jgi:protein subunit release factor B
MALSDELDEPLAPRDPLDELLRQCLVRRTRGSGPGGQHRNKVETRIELLHLPTGLSAAAEDSRSQHRNLRLALERLAAKLAERERVTKPRIVRRGRLRRVKERILQEKKQRAEIKRLRKPPAP